MSPRKKHGKEYEELGKRLKFLRDEAGLSQRAFAKKIGFAQGTYEGYESGTRKANLSLLRTIAEFYDISLDFLTGRTSDRKLHIYEEINEKFNKEISNSSDEEYFLTLYQQLDEGDRGEIRGEMKHMLKADKYSIKKK